MSLNVLIVDDCDLVRSIMAKTLGLACIPLGEVYQAPNGREAIRTLEANWIDLVIADLNMPVMDGVRMVDHMHDRGLTKTIPVVIVSTEGSITRMEQLREMGVIAYIRKPFTPEHIRDVIHAVIGQPDHHDRRALLDQTFCSVVEQFTLMISEPDPMPVIDVDMEGWVQAKLSFRGGYSGTLVVGAPKSLAREMAANALGVDSADPAAAGSAPEVLKELANLTCGRMLTDVAGEQPVLELSAPVLTELVNRDWREGAGRTLARYQIEGHPATLSMTIRNCET